jgi:YidC/Oxa1 family membrane protein insertase
VILTVIIRMAFFPAVWFQITRQRKSMLEQRKLAPQVNELRKKYKKDPQKLNAEMMKLYQEHGVNPLAGLVGCLPLVIQIPILTALYYVFQDFAHHTHIVAPFLFIPNLNDSPAQHAIINLPLLVVNLPIPTPDYFIFPLLAALTTLVQTRMLQMPAPPNPTEQELQQQQMQRTMLWISPVMFGVFALQVPAGLGLYWFIGNCVAIIQQYFVVGWGNLLPGRGGASAGVTQPGGTGPRNGPGGGGPRIVPGPGRQSVNAPSRDRANSRTKKQKKRAS